MALVRCSECGGSVSTLAKACPHCGAPVNTQGEPVAPSATRSSTPDPTIGVAAANPIPPGATRSPSSRRAAPAPAAPKRRWLKFVVLPALVVLLILPLVGRKNSSTGSTAGKASSAKANPECAVRKANGSPGDRECDLVELCADRRYHQRKLDSARTMDDRVAALSDLGQVQRWLSEYRPEDVQRVCGAR